MKIPSRQNVIDWTPAAWESIDVNTIVQSFLRCGISNAVDGTEDHLIRDDIPREVDMDEDDNEDTINPDSVRTSVLLYTYD